MDLTPDVVKTIHNNGGTILSSSRGGFKLDHIMKFLAKYVMAEHVVLKPEIVPVQNMHPDMIPVQNMTLFQCTIFHHEVLG